jgi:NADH-quinone oxidoreductase subunit I
MAIEVKKIKRAGGSFKEKLYLPAIFSGMARTFKHFKTNLLDTSNIQSCEYPEQKISGTNERYRAQHRLTLDIDGDMKCVACFMCATNCPSKCIFIEAGERTDGKSEKMPVEFKIDLLECVYCGFCVEACPHDAIRMDSDIYTKTEGDRDSFIVNRATLLATKQKES